MLGLHAGARPRRAPEPIPDALLPRRCRPTTTRRAARRSRQALYVAITRARARLVLAYPRADDRGAALAPSPLLERGRARARGAVWQEREEELFGPAETLHSTYRLLRDELLEGTMRAGGRLGELRFDTDLDVSHAVVRYLELLKLAALIAGGRTGQSVAESLRDVNSRILQAVTAEQREIFESSAAGRLPARRRARRAPARARRSPRATSRRWSRSCRAAATAWCCRRPTSTPTGPAR